MAKNENDTKKSAQPTGAEAKAKNGKAAGKKELLEKKNSKTPAKKPVEKGPSFFQRAKQFFREVKVELKKVTWPSRKETIASTSVVLIVVFLISIFLGVVDIALSRALKILLH
ncbi:MAG: preprotein translocase subunit SecE [Pseudomonadota bacterium]